MGENLKKFVDLYTRKADEAVTKSTERLAKFTDLREKAIASTLNVGSDYESLGKLVEVMFPIDGGVDDALFERYTRLEIDKEERETINKLFNLKNAPVNNKNAIAIKEKGGEAFFREIRGEIGAQIARSGSMGSKLSFNKIIGATNQKSEEEKIEDFNNFVEDLSSPADRPRGVLSGPELYMAIVESGDPIGGAGQAERAGPINEESKKEVILTQATSAVNPEEAITSEADANIGQVAALPPTFPDELKADGENSITINVEPQQISSAPVSEQSSTLNRPVESDTINQSQPPSLPESDVINQSQSQMPSNASINANEPTGDPVLADLNRAMTTATSEKEFYKSIFGESFVNRSNINELNKVVSSESTDDSLTSANTINTFNNTNEKNLTTTKKKSLDETLKTIEQYYGFNTDSPKSTDVEEVTQTKIDLPEPVIQNNAQTDVNSNTPQSSQSTQLQTTGASQNTEGVSTNTSSSINEVSEKPGTAQMSPVNVKTAIDLSPLEQRLARIEYALSFPLEVKIIN